MVAIDEPMTPNYKDDITGSNQDKALARMHSRLAGLRYVGVGDEDTKAEKSQVCQMILDKEFARCACLEILERVATDIRDGYVDVDKKALYALRDKYMAECKSGQWAA